MTKPGLLPLDRLQREMTRHILREAGTELLLAQMRQPGSGQERLEIHHQGYLERLSRLLRQAYPALEALIGAQDFVALSYAYACAHPSRAPNPRWFGGHLAEFLVVNGGWDEHPAVAEMARFEWALGLAADAADAPVLPAAAFDQAPPGGTRLRPHPSLHLLALAYDVAGFWQAWQTGLPMQAASPEPLPLPARNWAVWRDATAVRFRQLAPDESEAIWALRGGADFAGLCAVLARHAGRDEAVRAQARALGLLRHWGAAGWLSTMNID